MVVQAKRQLGPSFNAWPSVKALGYFEGGNLSEKNLRQEWSCLVKTARPRQALERLFRKQRAHLRWFLNFDDLSGESLSLRHAAQGMG